MRCSDRKSVSSWELTAESFASSLVSARHDTVLAYQGPRALAKAAVRFSFLSHDWR